MQATDSGIAMRARGMSGLAVLLVVLAGTGLRVAADSWSPPSKQITLSVDKSFRVTIIPSPVNARSFEDEEAAAGRSTARRTPIARVERRNSAGSWSLVWRKPLVNRIAPTRALLSRDGTRLVTFDNWGSVGYGDDVVVIYDERGELVRKLSLEQILPLAYVSHLPRSISSRWWGRDHHLVDRDRFVELQVVPPGDELHDSRAVVTLRIRLADGAVQPGSGEVWQRAVAMADALQVERQAKWDRFRAMRAGPLTAPTTADTMAWQLYLVELAERTRREDEGWGQAMVLAAPGETDGHYKAEDITKAIERYDSTAKYLARLLLFASPTSDRLATLLAPRLQARRGESLKGLRIVFVGTAAEGQRIAEAAHATGADLLLVDRTRSYPAGQALPDHPPSDWQPPFNQDGASR
jgi:hypothetical protein